MRLHALRIVPDALPAAVSGCVLDVLDAALQQPLIRTVPVVDAAGVEYAFDLQLTTGFYLLVAAYVALRLARDAALRAWRK